jgi:saccharopine dehydrogenase-like NADP-dependent oxidoreductase
MASQLKNIAIIGQVQI